MKHDIVVILLNDGNPYFYSNVSQFQWRNLKFLVKNVLGIEINSYIDKVKCDRIKNFEALSKVDKVIALIRIFNPFFMLVQRKTPSTYFNATSTSSGSVINYSL